jgi:hypothetical protein
MNKRCAPFALAFALAFPALAVAFPGTPVNDPVPPLAASPSPHGPMPTVDPPAAPSIGVEELEGRLKALSGKYRGAIRDMMTGREKALAAYGLKSEAAKVRAERGKATSGELTPEAVRAATVAMQEADKAINQAIASRRRPSKESVAQLPKGMSEMVAGLKAAEAINPKLQEAAQLAKDAMTASAPADGPRLKAAFDLLAAMGGELPNGMFLTKESVELCAAVSRILGIPVPPAVQTLVKPPGQKSAR